MKCGIINLKCLLMCQRSYFSRLTFRQRCRKSDKVIQKVIKSFSLLSTRLISILHTFAVSSGERYLSDSFNDGDKTLKRKM